MFSAKEAVYKAWFPLTGQWLDFSEADIVFDPAGTFEARLLVPGPVFGGAEVRAFAGRFLVERGWWSPRSASRRSRPNRLR
ncbi:4'-phosphopantetheinyl transferase superfamily protein [Micromonospora sp. BRA006-A]|nr:4'-phosphopantetheinyl transferase superfamily protein [Micromonospora sp. BRA006-A]